MVPFACLLVLVPLVAAGGHDMNNGMDMNQMYQQMMWQQTQMQMQNQMQNLMQNQMKGWGWSGMQQQQPQQQQGNWWGMESEEDYKAYLKWCEERKHAMQEQEQQKELLKMWEEREEERKMEAERERHAKEAHERHESMMAQWKMWQQRLTQSHEFDDMMGTFEEMKHKYMFMVTMEMIKFCKCSDFAADIEMFFVHEGVHFSHGEQWELDDLEGIETSDAVEVARALANTPKADQTKAFFGGLAMSLCEAARSYTMQVKEWENQYNFLEKYH